MDPLTKRQSAVLDILDAQIAELEEKLKKAQPLINELNRLKATRRTLLSEKGTTSGAGASANARLSQEEVIHYLRENGPSAPADIASALGVDSTIVRSHLARHKDVTYENLGNRQWGYIDTGDELGGGEGEDDE